MNKEVKEFFDEIVESLSLRRLRLELKIKELNSIAVSEDMLENKSSLETALSESCYSSALVSSVFERRLNKTKKTCAISIIDKSVGNKSFHQYIDNEGRIVLEITEAE